MQCESIHLKLHTELSPLWRKGFRDVLLLCNPLRENTEVIMQAIQYRMLCLCCASAPAGSPCSVLCLSALLCQVLPALEMLVNVLHIPQFLRYTLP